jgi:N-acetyl-anhydromuramyl-L-alanine amidase AmpD
MGLIDTDTYKLTESNYHKEGFDKTQIVVGHTYQNGMLHYANWIYRLNGKNKKTANFTITKEGKIYQHYDPKYYSSFVNNQQDKASISIVLENLGWLKKDVMINRYIDWLGNNHKKLDSDVLMKRWRNHSYWDRYSEPQIESLKELVSLLCESYNIPKKFIGHNVFDENIDLFKGITFRSNYYQESTDVSPAFDMEILKNI